MHRSSCSTSTAICSAAETACCQAGPHPGCPLCRITAFLLSGSSIPVATYLLHMKTPLKRSCAIGLQSVCHTNGTVNRHRSSPGVLHGMYCHMHTSVNDANWVGKAHVKQSHGIVHDNRSSPVTTCLRHAGCNIRRKQGRFPNARGARGERGMVGGGGTRGVWVAASVALLVSVGTVSFGRLQTCHEM